MKIKWDVRPAFRLHLKAILILACVIVMALGVGGYKAYSGNQYERLLSRLQHQNKAGMQQYVVVSNELGEAQRVLADGDSASSASIATARKHIERARGYFNQACGQAPHDITGSMIKDRSRRWWLNSSQRSYLEAWTLFTDSNNKSETSNAGLCNDYVALAMISDMTDYLNGFIIARDAALAGEYSVSQYRELARISFVGTTRSQKGSDRFPVSMELLDSMRTTDQELLNMARAATDGQTEIVKMYQREIQSFMDTINDKIQSAQDETKKQSEPVVEALKATSEREVDLLRSPAAKHQFDGTNSVYGIAGLRIVDGLVSQYYAQHDNFPKANTTDELVKELNDPLLSKMHTAGQLGSISYKVQRDGKGYELGGYIEKDLLLQIKYRG